MDAKSDFSLSRAEVSRRIRRSRLSYAAKARLMETLIGQGPRIAMIRLAREQSLATLPAPCRSREQPGFPSPSPRSPVSARA
jgi:hypothetical protein